MIQLNSNHEVPCQIGFVCEESEQLKGFQKSIQSVFKGEFLQTIYMPQLDEKGLYLLD